MVQLRYSEIERGLVQILPELRLAADFYWRTEGQHGQDSGPYIFFESLFGAYVEVLLWIPSSPRRDELLRRAFAAVEGMLASSDSQVRELAAVGLLEGQDPGWLKRARQFVGPLAAAWLKRHHHLWAICASANDQIVPEILDGYHIRTVIARELSIDGVSENDLPGTTYAEGTLP